MRPTPYDSLFGELRDSWSAISAAHGRIDLARFGGLAEVAALLDTVAAEATLAANAEAGDAYLTLLYAAYRFAEAGETVLGVTRDRLEPALLGSMPAATRAVPNGACYIQLPERWIWAQVAPDAPHEPVDGCFAIEEPHDTVLLVAILGFRAERDGCSQVSVVARPDDLAAAAIQIRTDRFAPVMDGGREVGFRSIVSGAELLVLTQLALAVAAG